MKKTQFSILVIGLIATASVAQQVIDLGPYVVPYRVNNARQIVGAVAPPSAPGVFTYPKPFLWSNGTLNLFAPADWAGGVALDITSAGTVCGQAIFSNGTTAAYTMVNGTISFVSPSDKAGAANTVNGNGVVGGFLQDRTSSGYFGGTYPFIYENGLPGRLPDLGGSGGVNGLNTGGVAVGNLSTADFSNVQATLWNKVNGSYQLTVLPSLGSFAEAIRINDAGDIVGSSSVGPGFGAQHAILWHNTPSGYQVVDLGGLGGGQNAAYGINQSAQAVGFMSDTAFNFFGFLYANGTVTTLDTLAAATGWHFSGAIGINDVADIVGYGTPPGGTPSEPHGFMLHLALTPSQMIENMTSTIDTFNLNPGAAQSLKSKLAAIGAALSSSRPAACNQLNAFVNEVNAQDGKKLTSQQAAQLRSAAAALSTTIGC